MELQNFIKSTLISIVEGVSNAQDYVKDKEELKGTYIRPNDGHFDGKRGIIREVDFDVAVHASGGSTTEKNVGIIVASLGLGRKDNKKEENSSVSRIKFSIPILFKHQSNSKGRGQDG